MLLPNRFPQSPACSLVGCRHQVRLCLDRAGGGEASCASECNDRLDRFRFAKASPNPTPRLAAPPLHLAPSLLQDSRRHVDRNPICLEASMSKAWAPNSRPLRLSRIRQSRPDLQRSLSRFMSCRQSHRQFRCRAMHADILCDPYPQACLKSTTVGSLGDARGKTWRRTRWAARKRRLQRQKWDLAPHLLAGGP